MYINKVYVTCIEDCDCNKGGYFCQVYKDDSLEDELDYFCIHQDELEVNPSVEHWINYFTEINSIGNITH